MKTILLPFSDDPSCESALVTTAAFAAANASHIQGLFVRQPSQAVITDIVPSAYITQSEDAWVEAEKRARNRFETQLAALDIPLLDAVTNRANTSASWCIMDGLDYQVIGEYGRLFDLITVTRSARDFGMGWNAICEAALFESGRPVLIAPAEASQKRFATIVIAWNGSTETAHTIGLGMPILMAADQVLVLTVEGGMVPGPSGEQVASHLACHGIKVSAETTTPDGLTVGECMLETALQRGADLLVKGAYTHSRIRQMIFGGATEHVLRHATLPVFMAH